MATSGTPRSSADVGEDPLAPRRQRRVGGLLDGDAVQHGVGEGQADLDGVGAGVGERAQVVRPAGRDPPGDVRHEQAAAAAARGVRSGASRDWSQQLLQRGDVLVAPAGERHQDGRPAGISPASAARITQASACADSSAGRMPSVRASRQRAGASSSVTVT